MWLFALSSTQIHHGSEVPPCTRSLHSNSGFIVRRTRKTVLVIGWILAAMEMAGNCRTQALTVLPMRTCLIKWPKTQ